MDIGTLRMLTEYCDLDYEGLEPPSNPRCIYRKLENDEIYISRAMLPNGRRMRLLKTLISSYCEKNCHYCPFQANRDFRRVAFSPDQFAAIFFELYKSGVVDGLFISSGISKSSVSTQDRIINAVRVLRENYHYSGYVHLKIMPGAERDQILEGMKLANRLSVNLEAPNQNRLSTLTDDKIYETELYSQFVLANQLKSQFDSRAYQKEFWPSLTTQFVVGAADETDRELLLTTEKLYKDNNLQRVYFSSFNPIEGTDMEHLPPSDHNRMVRLYQASFLLRDYDYSADDLVFDDNGDLPTKRDPKALIAENEFRHSKLEINTANQDQLIRLPGIGKKNAEKITSWRRTNHIRDIQELEKLRIPVQKIENYILIDGKIPRPRQLSFSF